MASEGPLVAQGWSAGAPNGFGYMWLPDKRHPLQVPHPSAQQPPMPQPLSQDQHMGRDDWRAGGFGFSVMRQPDRFQGQQVAHPPPHGPSPRNSLPPNRHTDRRQRPDFSPSTITDNREDGLLNRQYRNMSFLGKGGYSVVIRGTHYFDDSVNAIKLIAFHKRTTETKLREVRTMAQLQTHPHIVGYKGSWIESR